VTWRAILREALRNVTSGTARVGILAAAFALAVLAPMLADQFAVRQLIADAAQYRDSGASVLIIQAVGKIDGRACERLAALPEVRAPGATRGVDPIAAVVLPSAPIPAYAVTAGYPAVLHAALAGTAGIVLSAPAAADLGVGPGGTIGTTTGPAAIAGVYASPDDGRRPGLGYAALIVTAERKLFDECWLDAWPQRPELAQLLLTTVAPTNDTPSELPTIGQFNTTLGAEFDGAVRFEQRLTRLAPVVTATLAATLAVLAIRLRRIELASARHSGVRTHDLLAITLLECAAWLMPVLIVAAAIVACLGWQAQPGDRAAGVALAAGACLAGAVAATLGTILAVLARTADPPPTCPRSSCSPPGSPQLPMRSPCAPTVTTSRFTVAGRPLGSSKGPL
jgi:hypothetical protein